MAPPFRKISTDQLAALVEQYPFARRIDSVLLSQSPLADRAGSVDLLVRLWRRDIAAGEPDVAWHLAVDAGGGVWLGRAWDLPAGAPGAFTILSLSAEREPARRAAALVQDRFGLRGSAQESTQESMAAPNLPLPDLILGDDGEAPEEGTADGILLGEDETEPPVASSDRAVGEAQDPETDDLILTLLRSGGPARATFSGVSGVEAVTGQEGVFPEPITPDIKETLRPHIVNLTEGRFSTGGLFETSRDDVDALFGEHLEQAVAGHGPGNPLRLVIWAHGGLVKERAGLLGAHRQILWWKRNGVYPLYFVWETGLSQSIGQLLGGRGGGEEGAFTDAVTDFTDKRLEAVARAAGGPSIWGVMKQNAHAAVDPATGGAFYVLGKIADFCRRHPGAVELHAVGHSAGAIFHASFLPAAKRQGVPAFKGLYLLAPAVRVDLFQERLAPLLGSGIEKIAIFTMNKDRELGDSCVTVYRKSLLYLIYYALEEKRETPILGLEISLRGDPRLKELFGLGGLGGAPAREVVWSRTKGTARPRSRSLSSSHGGFDEDSATMDSVLRRVLDNDAIPLSFERAGTLTAELAELTQAAQAPAPPPPPVPAPLAPIAPGPDIILGEESPEDVEDVPFTVLDAIERATEAAEGIGPQASEPESESIFEAVETISITFGPNAKAADVTDFSRQVLTDILRAAGLSKVIVSSTSRLPADQARVMYANLESQGVDAQRKLYKEPGRKVIEVYRQGKLAGKDAATIKQLMTDEIVRLGPTTVSRHASDPKILNVFDVAPSSVAKRPAFEAAVRAEKRVAKFLLPPNDPGYHLEIPQPAAVG